MSKQYTALRPEWKEFRLLRIRPPILSKSSQSIHSTPIECDLFVASRINPPTYLALSYTWGDPTRVVPIQINDSTRNVTLNLRTALEHIRQEHEAVIIWVDAVCIDQTNHEEKSQQVQIMTEIYASAECTTVWLGPAADGSDEIIEKCNQIGEKLARPKTADGMDVPGLTDLVAELNVVAAETRAGLERSQSLEEQIHERIGKFVDEAQQDVQGTIASLTALGKLLSREYWGRVWVHQEFVVPRDIVIQCEDAKIEISKFRDARLYYVQVHGKLARKLAGRMREILTNASPTVRAKMNRLGMDTQPESSNDPDIEEYKAVLSSFDEVRNCMGPPTAVIGIRRSYQKPRTEDRRYAFTLIAILSSVFIDKTANATHARDRIYAMLGMADDKEELGLVPNYDPAISDIEIYTDAARAMMRAGRIDLLSLAQHRQHLEKRLQEGITFPSWVPDWSKPIVRQSGHTAFAVSGKIPFKLAPNFTSSHPRQIELLGWTVDTIETLCPAWINPEIQGSENEKNTDTFLSDIKTLCVKSAEKLRVTSHEVYARVVDRETAHFRIPVADQERNEIGGIRMATKYSREGYNWINKSLLGILKAQGFEAMNAQSMKCMNYLEVMRLQKSRRPFLSFSGYVGLAPEFAEQGDVLVAFCGAKFPYVLRCDRDGTYILIGEAYVHGIMGGEFVKITKETETFILE
ncbi:HET-domain-containing protein [Hyaloscypha variabilis F]|uniref:HET-domain-containing protein n=1 Tax=Hyaloscypha variabilis (strain UAMH 11265 / GT02V1 / F) TaxID=1149755 RepID=A0A2J6QTP4_HYAVF|nr:HET-domain-containing protein [Hyaloscypha variabilis F]